MVEQKHHNIRVFISYPGNDGKNIAIRANEILSEIGYRTWFYPHNRTIGDLPWEEISEVILDKTDIFLYICTVTSNDSRGQMFESEYAMISTSLLPQLIIIDSCTCPKKLRIFNREWISRSEFSKQFTTIAGKLPDILSKTPRLEKSTRASDISK